MICDKLLQQQGDLTDVGSCDVSPTLVKKTDENLLCREVDHTAVQREIQNKHGEFQKQVYAS